MRFSLRQIEIFAGAARSASLSATADALGMSQSAASTALGELERRYGRPLFDRAGKRLRLNETGRALLPGAVALLEQAESLDAVLAGRTGPGPLRLGATQTIGNYLAPFLIERYATLHPGCVITLEIDNTAATARAVAEFRLDLALVEGECGSPELAVSDWRDDELVIVCAPAHRLAGAATLTLEDVLAERWAVRERGSGTRQTLDRVMRDHWTRWQIGIELQQIEAILSTVMAGSMIACVSRLAAAALLESGRLVALPVAGIDLRRRFYTVTHAEKFETTGMAAFRAVCEAHAADLRESQPA